MCGPHTFGQEPQAVGGGALLAQVVPRLQRRRLHAAGEHQPGTGPQRLHIYVHVWAVILCISMPVAGPLCFRGDCYSTDLHPHLALTCTACICSISHLAEPGVGDAGAGAVPGHLATQRRGQVPKELGIVVGCTEKKLDCFRTWTA
jgi:hypothetical protein